MAFFEHMAAFDDGEREKTRTAVAVANKRIKDQFGDFVRTAASEEEYKVRLSFIDSDLRAVVADVVAEYGGDPEHILASVLSGFRAADVVVDEDTTKQCGVCGARMKEGGGCSDPSCASHKDKKESKVAFGDPYGDPLGEEYAAPSGGNMDPESHGINPARHNDPKDPAFDPPCRNCHRREGAVDPTTGECAACGFQNEPHGEFGQGSGLPMNDPSGPGGPPLVASVKEARRPKMCPYHSEVTDISLATGDPSAGFNALSQHAWGDNHCKGGFQGNCNFRREMVTQNFWDQKADEAAERARQRALPSDDLIGEEPIVFGDEEGISEENPPETGFDIDNELEVAPSAVGAGDMAMAASTREADGPKAPTKDTWEKRESLPDQERDTFATGLTDEPSPKMDKKKWKPKALDDGEGNLKPIKTDDGTPWPTVTQDIQDPADHTKDFLEQTNAVREEQDLPTSTSVDDAGFNTNRPTEMPHTDTWSEAQNKPVTTEVQSSAGPQHNPLREILESEFSGFVPSHQVQAAIREHDGFPPLKK